MATFPDAETVLNKELDRHMRLVAKAEARVADGMSLEELEYQVAPARRNRPPARRHLARARLLERDRALRARAESRRPDSRMRADPTIDVSPIRSTRFQRSRVSPSSPGISMFPGIGRDLSR